MTSYRINNILDPSSSADAATKSYVDTATAGIATTSSVTTAITNALSSSGTQTNLPTISTNQQNKEYKIVYTDQTGTGRSGLYIHPSSRFTYNPNTDVISATAFNGYINQSSNDDTGIKKGDVWRLYVNSSGYVGIGTTTPTYPLDIGRSIAYTMSSVGWYAKASGSGTYGGAGDVTNISLKTIGDIWISTGSWLWITSDQRIKKNIVNLNADKMINVLRNMRPVSFDYIDPTKNNNHKHFGFIAQEINEILPEGISLNTDVIPNNMLKGGITKPSETDEDPHFTLKPDDTDITLQYLLLTTDSSLNFDTVNPYSSTNVYKFKVYCGDKWTKEQDIYIRSDYNVIDDKYTYVIGMKKEVYDIVMTEPTLFVYGQYVYDLHILDHDTIYTVATAALQEVDREQQADKVRIAELETKVSIFESKMVEQKSLINDILDRLKTLEKA